MATSSLSLEDGGEEAQLSLPQDELDCSICCAQLQDPFVTRCGHTFCYTCISTHLGNKPTCPSCAAYLTSELIFPNFLLNKILQRATASLGPGGPGGGSASLAQCVQQALAQGARCARRLRATDLDSVIGMLQEQRDALGRQERSDALQLLLTFLQEAKRQKEAALSELRGQLSVLAQDLSAVSQRAGSAAAAAAAAAGGDGAGAAAALGDDDDEEEAQRPSAKRRRQQAAPAVEADPIAAAALAAAAAASAAMATSTGGCMPPPGTPAGTIQHGNDVFIIARAPPKGSGQGAAEAASQAAAAAFVQQQQAQWQQAQRRQGGGGNQGPAGTHRAPPMRRPSQVHFHSLTAEGGLSTVTVDTAGLGAVAAAASVGGGVQDSPFSRPRAAAPGAQAAAAMRQQQQQQQQQRAAPSPSCVVKEEEPDGAPGPMGAATGLCLKQEQAQGRPQRSRRTSDAMQCRSGRSSGGEADLEEEEEEMDEGDEGEDAQGASPPAGGASGSAAAPMHGQQLHSLAARRSPQLITLPAPTLPTSHLHGGTLGFAGLGPSSLAALPPHQQHQHQHQQHPHSPHPRPGQGAQGPPHPGARQQGAAEAAAEMVAEMTAASSRAAKKRSALRQYRELEDAYFHIRRTASDEAAALGEASAGDPGAPAAHAAAETAGDGTGAGSGAEGSGLPEPCSGNCEGRECDHHGTALHAWQEGARPVVVGAAGPFFGGAHAHLPQGPSPPAAGGHGPSSAATAAAAPVAGAARGGTQLDLFSEVLSTATSYSRMVVLAEVLRPSASSAAARAARRAGGGGGGSGGAAQPAPRGAAAGTDSLAAARPAAGVTGPGQAQLAASAAGPAAAPGAAATATTAGPAPGSSSRSRSGCGIVSSVEMDADERMFAVAGGLTRIQVYDYADVLAAGKLQQQAAPGTQQDLSPAPVVELHSRFKVACMSYSPTEKPLLLASGSEGVVALWNVSTQQQVAEWEAPSRRVFGVCFSACDPHRFATASDDGLVKLWSTQQAGSVMELDTRAAACSVQFNPWDGNQVAVGSAAHSALLYDIRRPQTPLATLVGHRKAVSYVRFLSRRELVSASTDSTLRLWELGGPGGADLGDDLSASAAADAPPGGPLDPAGGASLSPAALQYRCARVFSGHTNERNFVGLAVGDGRFIATGSETNSVCIYYKLFASPSITHSLSTGITAPPIVGHLAGAPASQAGAAAGGLPGGAGSSNVFVSALCWRRSSGTLLAANSQGRLQVLAMAP